MAEGHPAVAEMEFEVWHTFDGKARAAEVRLPCRTVGFLTGIPWEQFTLPLMQGKRTLISLCNIGPVCSRDAITMIHDAQVHLSPASYGRGFRLWYRFVQPILGCRNRRLLTVSAYSRAQIAAAGICPTDRIDVVHNGVDHILRVANDPSAVLVLGLTSGRYVVALSTTQAHKNIAILLKAYSDPMLADLPLVLVGGTGREAFEAAGIEVPANVRFAGRVSDEALRGLMENALCLAFPSKTEGFGLPPLEAMALGCPALLAPCGALPEIGGGAVVYVPPDDAEAWASVIHDLAHSPAKRAVLATLGKEHARKFTWRNAALTLVDTLNRTC
ncbi:glycosyltransferase family 1 protein [Sphingomonas sp.]|uniref:glycosyltransferase family 4 protein n=1 Tax=Sphingomonas sp. TaxID=28214 RepID=UPI0025D62E71|nr:glycosyltransferase family 1 protein [Sphingomonas sp.]